MDNNLATVGPVTMTANNVVDRDVVSASVVQEVESAAGERGAVLVVPNLPEWVGRSTYLTEAVLHPDPLNVEGMLLTLEDYGLHVAVKVWVDLRNLRWFGAMWRAALAGRFWLTRAEAQDDEDLDVIEFELGPRLKGLLLDPRRVS